MRLRRIEIDNFRRIRRADIIFEPATFIIGPNNYAKSSIIYAVDALLSLHIDKIKLTDFREKPDGEREEPLILTGYFSDISEEVANSTGFKGRVVEGEFIYKKTYTLGKTKPKIETLQYPLKITEAFENVNSKEELLAAGIDEKTIETNDILTSTGRLKKGWKEKIPGALEPDLSDSPIWKENPGGIPQNVVSKLPKVIHVPSLVNFHEIQSPDKQHKLGECLSILFDDLIESSDLAKSIQENLTELEGEMDPEEEGSMIWKICDEVNEIIRDVFPRCGIEIIPSLQGVNKILRPNYEISLFSNVKTEAKLQGTGLARTAIFAMLRYHASLKKERDVGTRPLIVAFEEPELFLHPSAGNMLRDTIYSLGESDQIICTTHSPWMIDLSRGYQSLTRMEIAPEDSISNIDYGVSVKLAELGDENRTRVKMLQVFDDELSRVFFCERVVIVEGDSELLTIKKTINLLPDEERKSILSRYQVVKARGKTSIISLIKYLKSLGMKPIVIHDKDTGTTGAERSNQWIKDALGPDERLIILDKDLEDTLGYPAPSADKPYKAYSKASEWDSLGDVPDNWLDAFCKAFSLDKQGIIAANTADGADSTDEDPEEVD